MKITLSLAVLAVAASQAMAVVPVPIKECTKKVLVTPTDTSCIDFAAANGCTFEQLQKWNDKLRPDCANLDVGAYLCVSITPGAGGATTSGAPVPTAVTSGTAKATSGTAKPTSVPQPSAGNSTTNPVAAPSASATPQNNTNKTSGANGVKSSLVVAAFGVLASAVYML